MLAAARPPERDIYRTLWGGADYRITSPGEKMVAPFLSAVKPPSGETLIDFGCGTGRAGLALARAGLEVTLLDFADNCLDAEIRSEGLRFVEADLTQPMAVRARYGYCADVMEHIAPECVDAVIGNIMACVRECFFYICMIPDKFGATIGHALHLTVQPMDWWRDRFSQYVIRYVGNNGKNCMFYVLRG